MRMSPPPPTVYIIVTPILIDCKLAEYVRIMIMMSLSD
jgi:hypothetical protein